MEGGAPTSHNPGSAPTSHNPGSAPSGHHHPVSTSELMSSAKVLSQAAQSAISHKSVSEIDRARVAGAAEDLLGAAKQYGHIDEKSNMGQYLEKAEGYLHKVHSSGGTTTTTAAATSTHSGSGEVRKEDEEKHSGGGMGDYLKMAQGFMGK